MVFCQMAVDCSVALVDMRLLCGMRTRPAVAGMLLLYIYIYTCVRCRAQYEEYE